MPRLQTYPRIQTHYTGHGWEIGQWQNLTPKKKGEQDGEQPDTIFLAAISHRPRVGRAPGWTSRQGPSLIRESAASVRKEVSLMVITRGFACETCIYCILVSEPARERLCDRMAILPWLQIGITPHLR
jgi:hypothetical protein